MKKYEIKDQKYLSSHTRTWASEKEFKSFICISQLLSDGGERGSSKFLSRTSLINEFLNSKDVFICFQLNSSESLMHTISPTKQNKIFLSKIFCPNRLSTILFIYFSKKLSLTGFPDIWVSILFCQSPIFGEIVLQSCVSLLLKIFTWKIFPSWKIFDPSFPGSLTRAAPHVRHTRSEDKV